MSECSPEPQGSSAVAGRGTALVTGGGSGLGAAIARRLASLGWHTVICGRDADRLKSCARAAATDGLTLYPTPADVTDPEAVAGLFRTLADEAPPLTLCVNNAGRNYSHQLVKLRHQSDSRPRFTPHPLEDFERTVRLVLTGTFVVGRHAAEAMLAAGTPGAIVNVSSTVRHGAYAQSAYSAAKAGVESLTRTWAIELGEYGIRVSAVAPGVLDGEALRRRSAANERHAAYMADLRRHVPLRRWCDEQDVAEAVAFAAENPSVTGTVLEVDAGGLPPRVPPPEPTAVRNSREIATTDVLKETGKTA